MSWSNFLKEQNPNRYRYKLGDAIKFEDGAEAIVINSTVTFVTAVVTKKSLRFRSKGVTDIPYSELPDKPNGSFNISDKIRWSVGDVVKDSFGSVIVLYEEPGFQEFYGYVLQTPMPYYLGTRVAVINPYRDYILNKEVTQCKQLRKG